MSPPAPSLAHLYNPAASPPLKQGFITACIRLLPFQPTPPAVVRRMLPSLPLLMGGSAEAEGQTGRADGQAEVQVCTERAVGGSCDSQSRSVPSRRRLLACSTAHTCVGHARSVCTTALSTCAGDRHGCGLHSQCGVGGGGARAALPAGARNHLYWIHTGKPAIHILRKLDPCDYETRSDLPPGAMPANMAAQSSFRSSRGHPSLQALAALAHLAPLPAALQFVPEEGETGLKAAGPVGKAEFIRRKEEGEP